MQTVKAPYELDDIALLNRLCPPDPTMTTEESTVEHLTEAEIEEIFRREEAALQPLLESYRQWKRKDFLYALAELLCFCLFLSSLGGIVWQCLTYPHTLVIVYTKAHPATITTTLDLSTRTLAPVTITRSATRATTGTGHQNATQATGEVTFYNGNANPQTVAIGTVLTGSDGVQVSTDQPVTIPAANPPYLGQATIPATTLHTGRRENIQALDINGTVSPSVFVKNLSAFTGGRDARTFKTVAAKDLAQLTSTVSDTLTRAFTTAFPLQKSEAAAITACHTTSTPSYQIGEEATSVTLTASKTCTAVAYNQSQITRAATAAFTSTRPGANYHIVGSVHITLQSVTPVTVLLNGKWAFTFSQGYQDFLAEQIQGDTPAKARASLLKTGVIVYASVPNTLASADYITFLVLVS